MTDLITAKVEEGSEEEGETSKVAEKPKAIRPDV